MYLVFVDRVQIFNNRLYLSRGSRLLPCVDVLTDHILNARFMSEPFEVLQCLSVSIEQICQANKISCVQPHTKRVFRTDSGKKSALQHDRLI